VENDEWANGNRSAAEEAVDRIKDIVSRGLEEPDEQR